MHPNCFCLPVPPKLMIFKGQKGETHKQYGLPCFSEGFFILFYFFFCESVGLIRVKSTSSLPHSGCRRSFSQTPLCLSIRPAVAKGGMIKNVSISALLSGLRWTWNDLPLEISIFHFPPLFAFSWITCGFIQMSPCVNFKAGERWICALKWLFAWSNMIFWVTHYETW